MRSVYKADRITMALYNSYWIIGKNKMEKETPIPLKTRKKPLENAKTRHFPILIYRAGRGGLNFSSISSRQAGHHFVTLETG